MNNFRFAFKLYFREDGGDLARTFSREKLIKILDGINGKTMAEVDNIDFFKKLEDQKKMTGVVGTLVEQAVLGLKADSKQRPDIIVDGVPVEVKTTGLRRVQHSKDEYTAKEPMTITAVSLNEIVNEDDFETSHFWNKLSKMLIIFYIYNSDQTVTANEYARFPFAGYKFFEFSDADKRRLKSDWETVRDFLRELNKNYENPKEQYPRLSSELRSKLLYIDTAPKYPNPPRFRLKRSFVSSIASACLNNYQFDVLPESYDSYTSLERKCAQLTSQYKGSTISELINYFQIEIKSSEKLNKAISEQIIVKMFGGKTRKLNRIEFFAKSGVIAKTIVMNIKGKRTEDMKLFPIDFGEISNPEIAFEDSSFYDFFANYQMFCIIFKEKDKNQRMEDNEFVGFKRLSFSEEFIQSEVKKTWDCIRDLVINKKLVDVQQTFLSGQVKRNKNGVLSSAPNFPKSSDFLVFVRGSGKDSSDKPLEVNGIKMLKQYIWFKGEYIINLLEKQNFL